MAEPQEIKQMVIDCDLDCRILSKGLAELSFSMSKFNGEATFIRRDIRSSELNLQNLSAGLTKLLTTVREKYVSVKEKNDKQENTK